MYSMPGYYTTGIAAVILKVISSSWLLTIKLKWKQKSLTNLVLSLQNDLIVGEPPLATCLIKNLCLLNQPWWYISLLVSTRCQMSILSLCRKYSQIDHKSIISTNLAKTLLAQILETAKAQTWKTYVFQDVN